MSEPARIQLSRRKGWRMPENTVSVARPGRWGNPYRVSPDQTAFSAVMAFRTLHVRKLGDISALRGKNLACWCPLCDAHKSGKPFGVECTDCSPCHSDVLGDLVTPLPATKGEG